MAIAQKRVLAPIFRKYYLVNLKKELIKVVVVEDEALYRDMIAKALAKEGDIEILCTYDNAENAKQGILQLKPDVALMDIELGDKTNGIKLALQLRELLANLGIVILSNHSKIDFAKILARQELKGWAYLLKKSVRDVATLHRAVNSAAEGNVLLDEKLVEQLRSYANNITHSLTPRQWEILDLLSQGYANITISEKLGIAKKSVENQLNEVYRKLGLDRADKSLNARVKAVLMYLEGQI